MFNHILVPLDGSTLAECVLPHAIAFAKVFDAQVTLLRVLVHPRDNALSQAIDPLEWQLIKNEAETYLNNVTTQLEEFGLKINKFLLEGHAAHQIVEFTYRNEIDLIILSSHGHSGLSGWNVSSVVQKIILRAYTSTLIIRAYRSVPKDHASIGYQRLLVPLDGSRRAENVLPPTTILARYYNSQLLLVHLARKPEMFSRTTLTPAEVKLVNKIINRNQKKTVQYLEEICSQSLREVKTRIHISEGSSEDLHNVIEHENIDLVVLNAHGQSCNPNWPFGSFALSFIAYGRTPLLIVQDLSREEIQKSVAELVAMEEKGH